MLNLLKDWLGKKGGVNYPYFSFFLLFLITLSLSHFLNWNLPLKGIPLLFFLYALGQAFLEVLCFVCIAYLLKRFAPKWVYLCYIGISFLLMLAHFAHFVLVRIMDASLLYVFNYFFGSGVDHLIAGFQALNLNATMIALIAISCLAIPFVGVSFYLLTSWLIRKKPFQVSLSQIILAIGLTGLTLVGIDLFTRPFLNRSLHSRYQKTLPLGITLLPPTSQRLLLQTPLPPCREEKATRDAMPKAALKHLPNLYLFVIETLRRDYLDAAPAMVAFGKENISCPRSYANAGCTFLSWFSIFHSDLPFYWAQMRDLWSEGSVPLQMLKNMGYTISVYSSADLHLFNMDKLIFGQDRKLASVVEEYSLGWHLQPCDRDALCFKALENNLKPEGQVYIVFLDSTHSEYSFPADFPLQYQPIKKEIDYLLLRPNSPELEMVKNRYRNAIRYVDTCMDRFFQQLKEKGLYEDAIIAITGDHGEEFFEEGALFHGIHINEYTTSVPILLKFPSREWTPQTDLMTHIDLFPSILHYLTKQSDFRPLFDGRSIFSLNPLPFRMVVFNNGPYAPTEFLLENSELKLKARFLNPSQLEILELQGSLAPDILLPLSNFF